jgi:formamidopyrimidine-DNA glycosylase
VPELPEVERVRLSLRPHVIGRRVRRAVLHREDICESFEQRRTGMVRVRPSARGLLQGDRVASLERHGKQLAIIGESGRVLSVHLGMSGQLLWVRPGQAGPATHVHAEWEFAEGRKVAGRLVFRDPRRFGGLWTFDSVEAFRAARWAALGPDALAVTPKQLAAGLGTSKRAVKAALLDQGVIAGVGNIYADEALFLAGVKPTRRAGSLDGPEVGRLAAAIREVLQRSLATGGSTLRDYVDADGARGSAQEGHAVYGRGGEACRECGGTLKQGMVAQRTTVWCPRCQG